MMSCFSDFIGCIIPCKVSGVIVVWLSAWVGVGYSTSL